MVVKTCRNHEIPSLAKLAVQRSRDLRDRVCADTCLVVYKLLIRHALVEHGEQLNNVRVICVELVAGAVKAQDERPAVRSGRNNGAWTGIVGCATIGGRGRIRLGEGGGGDEARGRAIRC